MFDGATGQMVQTLSQSTETISAGGLEWSYRLGVPEEGVEAKPHKVVLVHGAGLLAFTYSKLMRELQTQGYVCVAPDMPGHGGTSKPPPASFAYDLSAYRNALGAFLDALDGASSDSDESSIDLVVSGLFTSQAALLFAADQGHERVVDLQNIATKSKRDKKRDKKRDMEIETELNVKSTRTMTYATAAAAGAAAASIFIVASAACIFIVAFALF